MITKPDGSPEPGIPEHAGTQKRSLPGTAVGKGGEQPGDDDDRERHAPGLCRQLRAAGKGAGKNPGRNERYHETGHPARRFTIATNV